MRKHCNFLGFLKKNFFSFFFTFSKIHFQLCEAFHNFLRTKQMENTNNGQQNGTHWHCRVMLPTLHFQTAFIKKIKELLEEQFFTYAVIADDYTLDKKRHLHCALGCSRSYNKFYLAGKLGLRPIPEDKPFTNWYLNPVYKDSSPLNNANYVRKGTVLLDVGVIPDVPIKNIGAEATKANTKAKYAEMIKLAKLQQFDEIAEKYPREWIHEGAKLRVLYERRPTFL